MTPLLALIAAIPAGTAFTCTPVAVYDSDGPIWCAEGPHIRVSGIAAREADGSCRPGHPCPAMRHEQARPLVIRILGGRVTGYSAHGHALLSDTHPLRCVAQNRTYGRTAAICTLPNGRNLGRAIIASGAAVRWGKYTVGEGR